MIFRGFRGYRESRGIDLARNLHGDFIAAASQTIASICTCANDVF